MYRVTKQIYFCYGHRLMDYDGPCRHPHGHNSRVDIELSGEIKDKSHILFKFEGLKEVVQGWIDRELDHKMLLRKDDPLVAVMRQLDEPCYLFDTNPTAEAIARLIYDYSRSKGLPVSEIRVWEGETSYASYRED
ncbi:MAG: 6-carboxytetrahydropterin synthase [bacterium]|nr:6-carboxytetrahydropterin synthase [bacterium]